MKLILLFVILFSNISGMEDANQSLLGDVEMGLTNQNVMSPQPPPGLAPWEIKKAKKLAIQMVNEALKTSKKFPLESNKEAREHFISIIGNNKELNRLINKFIEKINKDFNNFIDEHNAISKKSNRVTKKRLYKEFWKKIREDICKSLNIKYDEKFETLTKQLPEFTITDLQKLQLKATQAKVLSYSAAKIYCRLIGAYIIPLVLGNIAILASSSDEPARYIWPSVGSLQIIACICFLIYAIRNLDLENTSDIDALIENVGEAIRNYIDTDIISDDVDDDNAGKITEIA